MGNTSEVLYVESNKKRINAFGTLTGLQLPVGGVNSTNTILPSSEKVNNKNSVRDSVKDSEYLELAKNPEKNEARLRGILDFAVVTSTYSRRKCTLARDWIK